MPELVANFEIPEHPKLLCIGAHCDDIEIGCSGTMLRLMELYSNIHVTWFILTGDSNRQREAKDSARRLAGDNGRIELVQHQFRDGFLPYSGGDVKNAFEQLKKLLDPSLILCHWGGDFHQDHRLISELTWNTFRGNQIFEYEIPKFDGDLGRPNVFVPLSTEIVNRKIDNLMQSYPSQAEKSWFDAETFKSLHRMRAIEIGSPYRYAEGFYSRKIRFFG